ncbi:MAG: hypothetical protein KVP17_001561 [Porospora cf. gigantea B]|uniref:uncharacterized protein n=1 Tax=Porospora cf. gigantea B TaxID=2853592 RepID=UPI003571E31C|nr:MAG: hypothetical protein KVP17_001561 [Porospora cf. gigantea B]
MHHVSLLPDAKRRYHFTAIIEPQDVLVKLKHGTDGVEVDERAGGRFLLNVMSKMGIEVVLFSRLEDNLLAQLVPNLDEKGKVNYVMGLSRTVVGAQGTRYRPLSRIGRSRYVFIHSEDDPNADDPNSICVQSFQRKEPDSRMLNLLVWMEHLTRFPNMSVSDFIKLHEDQLAVALTQPLNNEGYIPPIPISREICEMAERVLEPRPYQNWLSINREVHIKPVSIPAFPEVYVKPPEIQQQEFQLPTLSPDFLQRAQLLYYTSSGDGSKATMRIDPKSDTENAHSSKGDTATTSTSTQRAHEIENL